MRTYLMLAAKAREFDNDPRVKEAQVFAGVTELAVPTVGSYSRETADRLLAEKFDPELLASRNYGNDGLDQLVIDRILGM
jgi:xylose isomerase